LRILKTASRNRRTHSQELNNAKLKTPKDKTTINGYLESTAMDTRDDNNSFIGNMHVKVPH
jgi:hypothetical protein